MVPTRAGTEHMRSAPRPVDRLSASMVSLQDPRLIPEWRSLQQEGAVTSPFCTWQWAEALAGIPEVSERIEVLRVTRGERPIGLLAVERWRRPDRLRAIGLAGAQWLGPDHIDIVAPAPEREAAAAEAARLLVRMPAWDILDLEGLAAGGALAEALLQLRPAALRLPPQTVMSPYISLRREGERPLLASRNVRQQVARGLRAAERAGGGLTLATSPAEVTTALSILMRLHRARFGDQSAVFATPERRRFHIRVSCRLAEQGLARVYRLQAAGQDAALLYVLRLGDRLHYYSMGMRPDLLHSPGRTLLGQVVLAAAAEGFSELDLLRGEHPYKIRMATGIRHDVHLRLLRPTPRTVVAACRATTRRAQHAWGREA